ncbi:MAG: phosphoribosyltransferase [Alphaproteobacteria bacterium]|nr:phosphoribosyltransferase [Alphaproteobacteria bacterium]MBL7099303.1 phosphoribosyltransferase [Alphaproteobacteria bacterium]
MLFANREDAGRRLAAALAEYRGKDCVVLALPRGGVPIAAIVADAIAAQLDLLLVRKIGATLNPELAIGAIVDGSDPIVVRNLRLLRLTGTTDAAFDRTAARELAEIERRRELYLRGRAPLDVKGRTVIVIDDGIATGATMQVALKSLRDRGAGELVVATPVASQDALEMLAEDADRIVCLASPDDFPGVGAFYGDFRQLEDEDVIRLLAAAARRTTAGTRRSGARHPTHP